MKVWYAPEKPHQEYDVGEHEIARFSTAGRRTLHVVLIRNQNSLAYVVTRWDMAAQADQPITKPMTIAGRAVALARAVVSGGEVPPDLRYEPKP